MPRTLNRKGKLNGTIFSRASPAGQHLGATGKVCSGFLDAKPYASITKYLRCANACVVLIFLEALAVAASSGAGPPINVVGAWVVAVGAVVLRGCIVHVATVPTLGMAHPLALIVGVSLRRLSNFLGVRAMQ